MVNSKDRGRDELRVPYIFSAALAALMVVQSVLGLLFQEQYRDVESIKATWFGNDWVTLTTDRAWNRHAPSGASRC